MIFLAPPNSLKVGMYVCIKVALRGVPMESGVQLGLGPIKSGSNVPTLQVPSVPRHTGWFVLALDGAFRANFNLGS